MCGRVDVRDALQERTAHPCDLDRVRRARGDAAFEARPRDLALPELDRLRAESIAATPLAPADRTERSMPAFLIGRPVDDSILTSRNELKPTVRGRADVGRSPPVTLFSRARGIWG